MQFLITNQRVTFTTLCAFITALSLNIFMTSEGVKKLYRVPGLQLSFISDTFFAKTLYCISAHHLRNSY